MQLHTVLRDEIGHCVRASYRTRVRNCRVCRPYLEELRETLLFGRDLVMSHHGGPRLLPVELACDTYRQNVLLPKYPLCRPLTSTMTLLQSHRDRLTSPYLQRNLPLDTIVVLLLHDFWHLLSAHEVWVASQELLMQRWITEYLLLVQQNKDTHEEHFSVHQFLEYWSYREQRA